MINVITFLRDQIARLRTPGTLFRDLVVFSDYHKRYFWTWLGISMVIRVPMMLYFRYTEAPHQRIPFRYYCLTYAFSSTLLFTFQAQRFESCCVMPLLVQLVFGRMFVTSVLNHRRLRNTQREFQDVGRTMYGWWHMYVLPEWGSWNLFDLRNRYNR